MIVIPRKKGESIVIDDDIILTVIEIRGDKVRLGVELPQGVTVHRREVYEAILSQQEVGQGTVVASRLEPWLRGRVGSDDAPAEVVELGGQRRGEARQE